MPETTFYLGTHMLRWLERTAVPLFISRRRLENLGKRWPRAVGPVALLGRELRRP